MKCEFEYCIYNKECKCALKEIGVNSLGIAANGSGININDDCIVTMTDTTITLKNSLGDGLALGANVPLTVSGSSKIDVQNTGGIGIIISDKLEVKDGGVVNFANTGGDGIQVSGDGAKFIVSENGTVNVKNSGDKGIYTVDNGKFNVTGGALNIENIGGIGVFIDDPNSTPFTISGGIIKIMNKTYITGVYVNISNIAMNGGTMLIESTGSGSGNVGINLHANASGAASTFNITGGDIIVANDIGYGIDVQDGDGIKSELNVSGTVKFAYVAPKAKALSGTGTVSIPNANTFYGTKIDAVDSTNAPIFGATVTTTSTGWTNTNYPSPATVGGTKYYILPSNKSGNVTASATGYDSKTMTVADLIAAQSPTVTFNDAQLSLKINLSATPTAVTLNTATADGTSSTTTSTKIDLVFSQAIVGLVANDITITDGTGAVAKGALTGSGANWSVALTSVTTQGDVSVAVASPTGYTISGSPKTVAVYKAATPTAVTLNTATADGTSSTTTSTKIDLVFSQAIVGLVANDITITDGTGAVVKGALTGSGTNWSIALNSVTTQGDISVAVASPTGYTISGSPKTVPVYKAVAPTAVTLNTATADGTSSTTTSTKIDLVFSQAIVGLVANDITITDGTGAVAKGALTGSGTNWSIALNSVTTQGDISVAVASPTGYTISGSPKTVPVYKVVAPTAVTLNTATADGTSSTTTSTKIDLVFSQAIVGLDDSNITINDGTGAVVKGALTGSGTNWSIALTSVTAQGNVSVAVANPTGYTISGSPKTVPVYKAATPTAVTLNTATADGTSSTTTSTKIDLVFSQAIVGLDDSNITINDGTGAVVKGALTGSGTNWSIALTSVTAQGNVSVAVANPTGYTISGSPKTVPVYKAATPTAVTLNTATADGTSSTTTSTKIDLVFSQAIVGLVANDITITDGTGAVAKGALTGSGANWSIALNSVTTQGDISVAVASPTGYTISGSPKTVPVYKVATPTAYSMTASTLTNFGALQTGYTQPAAQTVTITNNGTGAITLTQPTSTDYTIGTLSTPTLAVSGTATFTVQPKASLGVGTHDETITISGTNSATATVIAQFSVSEQSSGGSGGGDSSSGGGNNNSTTNDWKAETGTNPDMRTKATKPLSGTPDKNGLLSLIITKQMVDDGIKEAKTKWQGREINGILLNFTNNADNTGSLSVQIEATAIDRLVSEGTTLELSSSIFRFGLDSKAIKELDSQTSGDVTVTLTPYKLSSAAAEAIGKRPVFDILFKDSTGKTVTKFGKGSIVREIKYTPTADEKTGNLYIVKVVNGKPQWIDKSSYDNGWMIWNGDSNSVYGVGYKNSAPTFTDTTNHWAKNNIDFVASRGLISGVTATTFAPDTAITRAIFLMALGKLSGADVSGYKTSSFTDVPSNSPAMPYIEWAVKNKITNGIGDNKFGIDQKITREQMATMMVSYAKATGYKLPVSRIANIFADDAKISSWATDAVKAIQQAGIISGKSNNVFDPSGNATRAEASTILRRFIELVIDEGTARGWSQNDAGQWQYITTNGKALTGWLTAGNNKYYFDANGVMVSGKWVQIGNKWYYFYADGKLAINTTVDGYEIGADGSRKEK